MLPTSSYVKTELVKSRQMRSGLCSAFPPGIVEHSGLQGVQRKCRRRLSRLNSGFFKSHHCNALKRYAVQCISKYYSHSVVIVLPSRHSSCTQFSAASRSECR